jgi:hypothetical protein
MAIVPIVNKSYSWTITLNKRIFYYIHLFKVIVFFYFITSI